MFWYIIILLIVILLFLFYKKIENFENKLNAAYFLGHNGLGDNITNKSAIKFLSNYYNTIYFICKESYIDNIKLIYKDISNVELKTVRNNFEYEDCKNILENAYNDNTVNIFLSGDASKEYGESRITHPDLLNYKKNDKNYTVEEITQHIKNFYQDIGLDLSIYYEYFDIQSTQDSMNYYNMIKDKNIIFMHTEGSNRTINLDSIIKKNIDDSNTIMVCANKNVYPKNNINYDLANKFIDLYITYYIDIIKNANDIYIINSCFSCIIYPWDKLKKLKSKNVNIYHLNNNEHRII
jgi:hypothetical protein